MRREGLQSSGGWRRRELLEQRRLAELQPHKDGALRGRDLAVLAEAPGSAPEAPELQLRKLVVYRMRRDARTKANVARRSAELGKREIMRCLKRYVAREVYHVLLSAT